MSPRTVEEIQQRIDSREARVYTASEFKRMIRSDPGFRAEEADVVTCGTFGVMSGTMAVLTVPVAEAGSFKRADSIALNGVPGNVGPCPNESLGLVDCIVYGTAHRDMSYGGGHLFKDMVAGKEIDVEVQSEGRTFKTRRTLSEIPFARMILTRGAFKNYTCFVNGSDDGYDTIFSGPAPLGGGCSEASVSGCGEINPLQNDPGMRYLRPGSAALLNGAPAMILGCGTRSSPQKPNLSIEADMHRMDPDLMGGFRTSAGPECLASVGAAIPMTSDEAVADASVLDEDTPMPLADVRDRVPVSSGVYASVWRGTDIRIRADPERCLGCTECSADAMCPVDAKPSGFKGDGGCMSCGLCVRTCKGGAFEAELGTVRFGDADVPIAVRQSSRDKAETVCEQLKTAVEEGRWKLRDINGTI